jgi:murein DD-endopeptidase MepM/ murein hydrolase activator NlpD
MTFITVAVGIALLANPMPVAAHNYTAFLASPYYGPPGDGVFQRWTATHDGIDFLLRWAPVLAAADGNVDRATWNNPLCHDEGQPNCGGTVSGFGLYVRINHSVAGEINYTFYGHSSVARTTMGTVRKGEWIGTSGDSGNSTGPHLHFEVRHGCDTPGRPPAGCAVNPDNAGGSGVSLWNDGEWSGANPAQSVPAWRFPTLSTYGGDTIVDDTPDNTAGFTKGRNVSIACPPDSCPYWYRVTTAGYGGDYYWTYDNNNVVDYWAEWRPNLPAFGNYEASAWIPCSSGGGSNNDFTSWRAPYHIQRFDAGTSVIVDQLTLSRQGVCNRWIGLGVYLSQSGTSTRVRLTDASGETDFVQRVGADAIKFTRVNVGAFEAENYRAQIPRSNHSWQLQTSVGGYFGSGYMQALPNATAPSSINTGYTTTSPELQYRVAFPTAGTYDIWLRGYGGSGQDDSIHAGLDGQGPASADRICGCGWINPGWQWGIWTLDGNQATIYVGTPGLHTVHLWMREDGFRVDQVLFTQDAGFTP